ncbi:CARDB domain-containing protein [Lewinella sp. IMCC34191]|uniref:CARDB domain-containing protein n=1 Tax=Lewinella sp. IMCC34191 TaxID=2259172 RepID=UPI00130075C8|nr:CARDB domain-containing protein [Lewinella sp. IMCC34191]
MKNSYNLVACASVILIGLCGCSLTADLTVPAQPLYVGSYHSFPVRTGRIPLDSVAFLLDNPAGGQFSQSRDASYNPAQPTVMFLAGHRPGRYRIEGRHRADNSLVLEDSVTITGTWGDPDVGPSYWFDGVVPAQQSGAAWGGGPPDEPQNTDVIPPGTSRKIAIVLIDTDSDRYTTDVAVLDSIKEAWMDNVIDGFGPNGISTRKYYQEVSYGQFDIEADVFGPVSLPEEWETYFDLNTDRNIWAPAGGYYQSTLTAADDLVDYNDYGTILFVMESVAGTSSFAWPYASIGDWGPYTTAEGNVNRGVCSMPVDWTARDGRQVYATFTHELGHNLRMGDMYTPTVSGRNPGAWEMMHADGNLPHFSLAHRMMLGWVDPAWVKTYNFASSGGGAVDENIVLSPIEDGLPGSGRRAGIEVRLTDGWNYYLEYRKGNPTHIGDRGLPTDDRVLGTDVVSMPYTPPFQRPAILLLPNDGDGDGSVLNTGNDYRETDFTDPTFPAELVATVTDRSGGAATINVKYGVNGKPDPSIRPWPAGPERRYQSPDIRIENARNISDEEWENVPWAGEDNSVIASVKNNGELDAPGVRVNFYIKDFNVGGDVPMTLIGSDTRDIPAGSTVEFNTNWRPPSSGHYCVVVRIPLYSTPGGTSVAEMTELNNLAQSNYDRFISETASPPSREMTSVAVQNPFDKPTRVFLRATQDNALYRTYLEHHWIRLEAKERRNIRLMLEFGPEGYTRRNDDDGREYKAFLEEPNDGLVTAFIEDPTTGELHTADQLGGVQVQVVTGRKVEFAGIDSSPNGIYGRIETTDSKRPVNGGRVIVRFERADGQRNYQEGEVTDGAFTVTPTEDWATAKAFYIPPPRGYGQAESEEIENR